MGSFFQDLKERRVAQWTVTYVMVAWVVLQVVDILGDQWDWSQSLQQSISILLGFGLLITLVVGWFHGERGTQAVRRVEVAALLVITVAGVLVAFWLSPRVMTGTHDASEAASALEGASDTGSARAALPPSGVDSLFLTAFSGVLPPGASQQLTWTAFDADRMPVATDTPIFESGDPSIARVSEEGIVEAIAEGATVVTARVGVHTAQVLIHVEAPTTPPTTSPQPSIASFQLSPPAMTLALGDSAPVLVDARRPNGEVVDVGRTQWHSTNPSVAEVTPAGTVWALRVGQATIEATARGRRASMIVTVQAPAVARVQIHPLPETLEVGEEVALEAVLSGADGSRLAGRDISWRSNDPSVATVSPSGRLRAVAAGRIEVRATSEGVTGSGIIRVGASAVEPDVAAADQEEAIRATVELYRTALADGEMPDVRSVYPEITSAQESAWRNLFALGTIEVAFTEVEVLEWDSSTARVRFLQHIQGDRLEPNTTPFTVRLTRGAQGWRILSLRSR